MVLKIWEDKVVTAHALMTYMKTGDDLISFLTLVINKDEWLALHPGRFIPASLEPEGASALELV